MIKDNQIKASNLKLRLELMAKVSAYFKQSGLTQSKAAKKLRTTQPILNDLLKGKVEKFKIDRLVNMLTAIGYKVRLRITNK